MEKQKVLIGLSGGVDSAVAALLLKQQGFQVLGAFMKNYSDTKNKLTGNCNYLEDLKDARKIASILKIPFIKLDFEKEYKKNVIDPMFKSYALGLTPNPDSLCNKIIKFPLLWKHAKKLKCDYIATGHYATITKTKNSLNLKIPKDATKDQTYFLYGLNQADLKHTLFPLYNITKEEVRAIARQNKFPNHNKKGTRGICFVGKINMKSFLKQNIKPKPGAIKNPEGKVIGQHNGIMYYTIGERIRENNNTNINSSFRNKFKSKLYIVKKSKKTNTLTIAPQNHPSLKTKSFRIIKTNFINHKPRFPLNCKVRIRHLAPLTKATISQKNNKLLCTLTKTHKGIADGQSCVIYQSNSVLGGGEIRFS